jgi:hypothetical protein
MTKKTALKTPAMTPQLFVYGEEDGKPRGARFPVTEMETLAPVLRTLQLNFYDQGSGPKLVELGMKLPAGRIYARGKAFIPNMRRSLYDQILAALAESKQALAQEQAARTAAADEERAKTPGAKEPLVLTGIPQDWQSIASGHLVLVEDGVGEGEGWWEAICVSREDDILTLRYRDYPKVPPFQRHLSNVALLHPGPQR